MNKALKDQKPTGGRPLGSRDKQPRRKARPSVARFPNGGNTTRVLQLATIWGAAVGIATGSRFRSGSWLKEDAPWEDPKQVRRWNVFVILDARLREWGADPKEFCAAAMEHFKWMVDTKKVWAFRPNVFQVCGEHGKRYWQEWHRRRKEEGAGSEQWVAGEAARATVTQREKLAAELRHATEECRNNRPAWTVTSSWGAEVLFLLWAYEPGVAPAVEALLKGELIEMTPAIEAARQEFFAIRNDDRRREYLLAERLRIFGCARSMLSTKVEPVPVWEEVDVEAEGVLRREAEKEFRDMERLEKVRDEYWARARRRLRSQMVN